VPPYVLNAGCDQVPLTWDMREHLDKVQVLARPRNELSGHAQWLPIRLLGLRGEDTGDLG